MFNQFKSAASVAESIFARALALEPVERAAFLDEVCFDSTALRAAVEDLLSRDLQAGSFLNNPIFGVSVTDESTLDVSCDSPTADPCVQQPARKIAPYGPAGRIQPGDLISDRFRVIRFIASGGMGEVYEVADLELQGVHLALKTILPHIAAKPDVQAYFEREVLHARSVVHSNLCPIYDIFHCRHEGADLTFLTMKLLVGETLAARISRDGPVPLVETIRIVHQVGAALTAAHDAGILHRDVKAANIMIDGSDQRICAIVTDFGLARAYDTESTLDGVAGTLGYLAPELFHGAPPSPATDVYAFGVVVYQMLAGHLPRAPLNHQMGCKPNPSRDLLIDPDPAASRANPSALAAAQPQLPPEWRRLLKGCLEPDPTLRFQTFPHVLDSLQTAEDTLLPRSAIHRITRRRLITTGAAATAALATGAWFNRTRIVFLLEPLPSKRFVALMPWPAGDSPPLLSTVLDSIGNRLARAEAHVKDLLIIRSSDLPANAIAPTNPTQSVSALGANLVLAASLKSTHTTATLTLQVLDAVSQAVIRRHSVPHPAAQISTLAEAACKTAALLLGLPDHEAILQDAEELKRVSPEAFSLYTEAEQLAKQPNGTGLEAAIQKYQQAVELEQHFALAYAKLALANIRIYLKNGDPGILNAASNNAAAAIRLNPDSAQALLSKAVVLLYSGKPDEAIVYFGDSQKVDSGNPETMLYKAQAYRNMDKPAEAELVYRAIVKQRPNFWPAYNELGFTLSKQGKYEESFKEFQIAAAVAPLVALPLANLGSLYLILGKHDEAIAACKESLKRSPNEAAYLALGDIAFTDKKYPESLAYYQQAALLNPRYHLTWRDIGDCYAELHKPDLVIESYTKAAQLLSEALAINPHSSEKWATLAFYEAKIGDVPRAEAALNNARSHANFDLETQFMAVQALAVLGRTEEAIALLLICMERGLSLNEIDLAIDLKQIQKDPRYAAEVVKLERSSASKVSR
jgi:serine/threonine protein kinase/predicted Zn-dependent protease